MYVNKVNNCERVIYILNSFILFRRMFKCFGFKLCFDLDFFLVRKFKCNVVL